MSERDEVLIIPNGRHLQIRDIVEGVNPGMAIRNRDGVRVAMRKAKTARVTSGRIGRFREGFHPRFESGSGRTELDAVEKVYSGPRNPRLRDKATCPERSRFIVQMADDEVEDLWGEGERHRGFRQDGRRCLPRCFACALLHPFPGNVDTHTPIAKPFMSTCPYSPLLRRLLIPCSLTTFSHGDRYLSLAFTCGSDGRKLSSFI